MPRLSPCRKSSFDTSFHIFTENITTLLTYL
nr:MAG TPA: hypothetical protein [Caudoviricetes sp.]DAH94789.1 MAG TPA: hypothetical protein [Caudoviricetes sp.]DAK89869.1 MAG TPA: hypothetical protein [Caudoviricetes sp.]